MTLVFEFKRVYGRIKFYPVCDESKAICSIAERLCLDGEQLSKLLVLKSLQIVVMHKDKPMPVAKLVALITGESVESEQTK